jgi:hypothetical protein
MYRGEGGGRSNRILCDGHRSASVRLTTGDLEEMIMTESLSYSHIHLVPFRVDASTSRIALRVDVRAVALAGLRRAQVAGCSSRPQPHFCEELVYYVSFLPAMKNN